VSEARDGGEQSSAARGRREQTDRSVSGILGNFLDPGRTDEGDTRKQERGRREPGTSREPGDRADESAPEAPETEVSAQAPQHSMRRGETAGQGEGNASEQPTSEARRTPRTVEPASRSREQAAEEPKPQGRVEPEVEQEPELQPALETNPAVTAMQELIARGKVPKHQKGYELPDTHEWALQDIRQHMMRVEKFTARQASASNCVAAALELYYHVLFGEPIER
jgi:hypothetical protein